MTADVFLSYARSVSRRHAQAAARALTAAGVTPFLDEQELPFGEPFPRRLVDALLDARVVVIFAEPRYFTRWYCRLEYEVALAPFRRLLARGAPEAERLAALAHVVIALPAQGAAEADLDAMPPALRATNWAPADDPTLLTDVVRRRREGPAPRLRERLDALAGAAETRALFTRQAPLPQPLRLAARPGAPPLPVFVPAGARGTLRDRFVGRADDLWRLHDALAPASTVTGFAALTSALQGVGGVGKTQLAAEYLHRYGPRHYTGGVFWLDAKRDVVEQHYATLRALGQELPDLPTLRQQVGEARVASTLHGQLGDALRAVPAERPVLVVVDDVPEPPAGRPPAPLEIWCPAADAAAYLVTSRAAVRFGGGGALTPLRVDVLPPEEAVAVLTTTVDREVLAPDEWRRIAEWVGHLPLGLTLLNSAMGSALDPLLPRQALAAASAGQSTAEELDALMDALRGVVPEGNLRGVTEAFLLSYEGLPADARAAARQLAHLGPAPIPLALADALGGPSGERAVRALLGARSFVLPVRPPVRWAADAGGPPMLGAMHAVLADFLRARAAAEQTGALEQRAAADALLAVMTPDACRDPAQWPLVGACAPHAEAVARRATGANVQTVAATVALHGRRGALLRAQGAYTAAVAALRAGEALAARALGPDHPEALAAMNGLAAALWSAGDFATSRALDETVLRVRRETLGPEHEDTLISMHNLAVTLASLGDSRGALALHEAVLEARTRTLGPGHPATLRSMHNVGAELWRSGELARAREVQGAVTERLRQLRGPEHPDTLASVHNLAVTLSDTGVLAEARALHEAVLEARSRTLGPEHPETLRSAAHLAVTVRRLGDLAPAAESLERAAEAQARVLGPDHPDTLGTLHDLAVTRSRAGDRAGAIALLRRVIEARRRALGPEHPDTARSALRLTSLLEEGPEEPLGGAADGGDVPEDSGEDDEGGDVDRIKNTIGNMR